MQLELLQPTGKKGVHMRKLLYNLPTIAALLATLVMIGCSSDDCC
jgi:hypothetical protein